MARAVLVAVSIVAFLFGWSLLLSAFAVIWAAVKGESSWLFAIFIALVYARLSLGVNRFAANRWNQAQSGSFGPEPEHWWRAQGRDFD